MPLDSRNPSNFLYQLKNHREQMKKDLEMINNQFKTLNSRGIETNSMAVKLGKNEGDRQEGRQTEVARASKGATIKNSKC